jgi:glycosyltransferase involved in cell wall biosynthesis
MHILYVTLGYKPAARLGGPVQSVSATAEGMVARGHRVTVYTTNSNLDEDLDVPVDQPVMVDGVEVWYFQRREPIKQYLPWVKYLSQSVGYMYTPALKTAMQQILPTLDIVHTQIPYIYPSRIAGRFALAAGKPLFYSQRGQYNIGLRYRRWKKLIYISLVERPIMRGATGLIALTQEEVDSYKALGVETPCYIVPNGVELEKFRRAARPGSLSDLQIFDEQKVILFLARLHPTKGADLLVRAFGMIAARHTDAVLVLAGPDQHGLAQYLRDIAIELGVSKRVIFTGMVSGERKLDLLGRADLFVLPSAGEGLSNAVLEALASGTAVVLSSEVPYVKEAGAGRIVERDAERLAEAISGFLADPVELAKSGRRAYELARQQFGWGPILARLERLYEDALVVADAPTKI